MNKNNIIHIILGLAVVILTGALLYTNLMGGISTDKAKELAIEYINNNLLEGTGITAEAKGEVVKSNGMYMIALEVAGEDFDAYMTTDGKVFFPQGFNLEEPVTGEQEEEEEPVAVGDGGYTVHNNEVCTDENGLPIVYFFGADWCPHCAWQHPVVQSVLAEFEGFVNFKDNMGTEDDRDVFAEYSTGGIPTTVLGCKYSKVGSGENFGEDGEKGTIRNILCELTNNEPPVCQ